MKAFFRWIARIVGSAIILVLVFVMFPYVSKFVAKFMPDESGAAIKASAIIATKMEESARLETLKVSEDGVLNYEIQAAFIGSVATINVSYKYEASFGIDLSKVEMSMNGSEITFRLPPPEVLQDSLTPVETYRDDFWYPGFSDADYQNLLENERTARREAYLNGEHVAQLWEASQAAFERTIASWLSDIHGSLTFTYEKIEAAGEN